MGSVRNVAVVDPTGAGSGAWPVTAAVGTANAALITGIGYDEYGGRL